MSRSCNKGSKAHPLKVFMPFTTFRIDVLAYTTIARGYGVPGIGEALAKSQGFTPCPVL
jgi:hypothetical protein